MTKNKINTMENIWQVAQKLAAPENIYNPYLLLQKTLEIVYRNTEEVGEIRKTKEQLLNIPMKRHENIINSFVDEWATSRNLKTDLNKLENKLEDNKLDTEEKELLDTLKESLGFIQDSIPEGFRTPLILLNELYLKYLDNDLPDSYSNTVKTILDDGNANLSEATTHSLLAACWLKQVASWQK